MLLSIIILLSIYLLIQFLTFKLLTLLGLDVSFVSVQIYFLFYIICVHTTRIIKNIAKILAEKQGVG